MRRSLLVVSNASHSSLHYRLPALERAASHVLLLAYEVFHYAHDTRSCYSSIHLHRSCDNGMTWTDPIRVFGEDESLDSSRYHYANPCFTLDRSTGCLFLSATCIPSDYRACERTHHTRFLLAVSRDDGKTWQQRDISTHIHGRDKWDNPQALSGHGIQLHQERWTDRILFPLKVTAPDGRSGVVTVCSDNCGATWWTGTFIESNAQGGALVELSDGRIMMQLSEDSSHHSSHSSSASCHNSPLPSSPDRLHVQRYYSTDGGRNFSVTHKIETSDTFPIDDKNDMINLSYKQSGDQRCEYLDKSDEDQETLGMPWQLCRRCWSKSLIRVFPYALPGKTHSRIILQSGVSLPSSLPSTSHSENDASCPTLSVSMDNGATFQHHMTYSSLPVTDADTVSLPDKRLIIIAASTQRGIELTHICLDDIGLHDYAYGWDEYGTKQDELLKRYGFIAE